MGSSCSTFGSIIFELQYFFEYKLFEWIWIITSCAIWNACDTRSCYPLPYVGLFENSLKASVINSFFVCILDPLRAILLILFNCAVVYMSVNTPERLLTSIYIFTFGGFAIWALLNVKVTSKMFEKAYKLSNGGTQDENF